MLTYSERIAQTAEHLIEHYAHGYSQPNRDGDGTVETITYSDGSTATVHGGDYDCSELVKVCANCAISGQYDNPISYMWTGNEYHELTTHGFEVISPDQVSRGDIVLREGHTEIYLGDGIVGGARIGDDGIDGEQGDQGGWEITNGNYDPDDWEVAFALLGSCVDTTQSEDEMICAVKPYDQETMYYVDGANVHPLAHSDELEALRDVYRRTHNGAEMPIFEMGHDGYPIHQRLFDALNRKM